MANDRRFALTRGRRVALVLGVVVALAAPIVGGAVTRLPQSADQPAVGARSQFEVASVKRNTRSSDSNYFRPTAGRFYAEHVTLRMLIAQGYGVHDFQISGGPDWIDAEHFDVDARAEGASLQQVTGPML